MQKVYFLDVDDCLIETSRLGEREIGAVRKVFKKYGLPHSREITEEFVRIFHRFYDHHQGKILGNEDIRILKDDLTRLNELEAEIVQKWGQIKKWSREVMLYIAAQKHGVTLNQKQIMGVAQKLWQEIAGHTPFYPDAENFLRSLIINHKSFYLITSSDCRLQYDEKKGHFYYDPRYSKQLKLNRLQKFLDLGVPAEHIFIGDPYDKPNPWVFEQALTFANRMIGSDIQGIMVGDSISNDLIPAQNAGIDKLIYINRHSNRPKKVHENGVVEVNSFTNIDA